VGQQQVFAPLVDGRPAALQPDQVADHRAQHLAEQRQQDDQHQREVEELGRGIPVGQQLVDLAAGQGAATDDGDLGAGRDAHRRDEAQNEDGEVAVVQEKVVQGRGHGAYCLLGPDAGT
jgi:hypothetical protein